MPNMVEISKLKLDLTDKKILAELDKNCRTPSTKLAKKAHKSRQAVEYRINQLTSKGIITSFNAAINPHKMGYKIYKVYLKLRNIPQEKNKLLSSLRSSGMVYWLGEFSGSWDLIFAVFAKSDIEFYTFKNSLFSQFNNIIVDNYGDVLIDVKQYPKMYFTNELSQPTEFAGPIINNELDRLDYEILGIIVNNARIPLNELAKKTNSTHIVVKNRLKKLKAKGVIIQYRISINLNKLGLELYKAIIKLDRYTKQDAELLLNHLSRLPNIHYFISNMWAIEPELVVSNYQEYYHIIEGLKKQFPKVIRTIDTTLMISDEWTPGFKNLLTMRAEKISKPR